MKPGFTLLETLVVVLILGFLLVGLSSGAQFGAAAALRQARSSDRDSGLDALDRALRQIVASADPAVPLNGGSDRVAFAANVPGDPGLKSVVLGMRGGRLVLRYQPKPPGLPLQPVPMEEAELASGLRSLALSYYAPADADHPLAGWQSSWSRQTLPPLLRVRVAFADGSATRWPDIVLATRRSQ